MIENAAKINVETMSLLPYAVCYNGFIELRNHKLCRWACSQARLFCFTATNLSDTTSFGVVAEASMNAVENVVKRGARVILAQVIENAAKINVETMSLLPYAICYNGFIE
jgi:hypothetical protein